MASRVIGVAMAMLSVVACSDGGKAAADSAIQALRSSYETVRADASRYVPEEARRLDEAFAGLQATLAKGEYAKALDDVKRLSAKVGDLGAAATAKKAELTKAWDGLSSRMPAIVQGVQTQVDTLVKAKKLPDGVTREALEAAKAAGPALQASWEEAVTAFTSANVADAMAKARRAKAKAAEIMASLGLTVPDMPE